MCRSKKGIFAVLIGLLTLSGSVWAEPGTNVLMTPAVTYGPMIEDDEVPEVTDRVARISFIDGEGSIRRNGSDEWEKLALNLPLVEGDEITTGYGARLELQFDKNQHLRLDGNSFLKITTLKDEGIAVSLSLGRLSVRLTSFDKDTAFFEIDAPKTTLAVQRAGRYLVDAGREGDTEVKASVGDGGEARIYSDNAGFVLKNGRSTRIFTEGVNAGEWDTADASRFDDEFSQWVEDRERDVAQRLKDAHYDRYYDDDIYGADDLNDNGDWINTADYGYVWQPSRLALSQYSDWSPYRYGHWRWMQPYGWIWVNDEPWGWATYHHGRWFSHNGRWVWSPYGYYRYTRSWWSPALVVINIFNNNVCWYPLPYHRRRYNYNSNHQTARDIKRRTRNPRALVVNVPPRAVVPPAGMKNGGKVDDVVPVGGVVAIDAKDFGSRVRPIRTTTPVIAKTVLSKDPVDGKDSGLPAFKDRRRSLDIATERPKLDPVILQNRTGAAPRKSAQPLDAELQRTKVFGGRNPQPVDRQPPMRDPSVTPGEPRKTGAVDRQPIVRQPDPVRVPDGEVREKPRRISPPAEPSPIVRTTPKETPRYTPPVRETPRSEAPKAIERPKNDPPKSQPPVKSEPKPVEKPSSPSRKDKPID